MKVNMLIKEEKIRIIFYLNHSLIGKATINKLWKE
jgi:hypothetical protein